MGSKDAISKSKTLNRQDAVGIISERFQLNKSVALLQKMSEQITAKEITVETVGAACDCISNLNNTIKTVIMAAKFISDE